MSPNTFPFTVQEDCSSVVVRFHVKELSDAFIDEVGDDLTRLAEEHKTRHLVYDLSQVDYVSSAALGKIVAVHKRLASAGGQLSLTSVNDFPYEVFCVTRLNTILDIRRKSAATESVPV